ncbi:MAG: tetratricopeptide repeat protein [Nannocystaceae bacterium]
MAVAGLAAPSVRAAPAGDVAIQGEAKGGGAKASKRAKGGARDAKRKARRDALFAEQPGEVPAEVAKSPIERRLSEATEAIRAAFKVAQAAGERSADAAAKRLVEGQILLEEGDAERAALIFLELAESFAGAPAGLQARFFLGEALFRLDMRTWAAECFENNLAASGVDAERFHQRSLGRLLDLSAPRRGAGFARRPGLSALPELRGRLRALGLPVTREAPDGALDADAQAAVVARVEGIADEDRSAELHYAYGRYLHLRGEHERALAELDAIATTDIPLSKGGPDAKWRVRAAYLGGVAALAGGDPDEALARFAQIIKAQPSKGRDKQIYELAWLARARIHHDRGDYERALKGYRRIARASPYYFTALYETAWTLLRADRFALAGQTLDRLLSLEPGGPLAPEIRQLRGKLRILQGDLEGAEAAFEELRKEFERSGKVLAATAAPPEYYAAIAGADMEGFALAAVLPASTRAIAASLPRAAQAESIAQTIGALDRELGELRDQLTRMEAAVAAPDRVRLFTDLGAQSAALDRAENDLIEVMEQLCVRASKGVDARAYAELERKRAGLRAKVDQPMSAEERGRGAQRRISRLDDFLRSLEAAIVAIEAEVVAAEHGLLLASARNQAIADAQVAGVIEMRQALAELQGEAAAIRETLGGVEVEVRFNDPYRARRAQAVAAYRRLLAAMYASLSRAADDSAENRALWRRTEQLLGKVDEGRGLLDAAAVARLQAAIIVVREERANLDQLKGELVALKSRAEGTVGEVVAATYVDVAGEIANWEMRSEVGKLDVAWARKEAEAREARLLERKRDRDQREIDRALEIAEELRR